ncbi:MAG: DUF4142 domain-containing protein [Chthoniobacterales bacterium]
MNIKSILCVIVAVVCFTVAPLSTQAADCGCHSTALKAPTPAQFAQTVATIDMLEVRLGQIALTNSSTPNVKKFGQRMITDHTKINKNLTAVAASQHIPLPTKLDAKHQAMVTKLSALKGAAFDNAYIPAMIAGHTQALAMFKNESATCTNPALKKFAKQTTPIIALHLRLAQIVQDSLK